MANLSGLFNLKLGASLPTKQQVKDYVNTTCKYPGNQQYRNGSKQTTLFEHPTNPNQRVSCKNPGVYLLESMSEAGNLEHSYITTRDKDNPYYCDTLLTNGGRTTKARFGKGDKKIYVEDKNNNGKIDAGEVTYTDKSGKLFDYFTNEKLPDSMSFLW